MYRILWQRPTNMLTSQCHKHTQMIISPAYSSMHTITNIRHSYSVGVHCYHRFTGFCRRVFWRFLKVLKVHLLQRRSSQIQKSKSNINSILRQPFGVRKRSGWMMSAFMKLGFLRDWRHFCLAGRNWGLIFHHATHSNSGEHAVTELREVKHKDVRYWIRL